MRTIKNLPLIILCCVIAACAGKSAPQKISVANTQANQQTQNAGLAWTKEELADATWRLIDDNRIENLSFYPQGFVAITQGVKTVSGSTTRAPIFGWSIAADGALVITDIENNVYEKLYKVESDDSHVTVNVNGSGRIQVYDRFKYTEPK